MKILNLKPGSIMIWKSYGFFKTLFAKLFNKTLPNNCIVILTKSYELSRHTDKGEYEIYEPKKPYSRKEQNELVKYLDSLKSSDFHNHSSEIEEYFSSVINMVRPNTVDTSTITLDNFKDNKYYKKVDAKDFTE